MDTSALQCSPRDSKRTSSVKGSFTHPSTVSLRGELLGPMMETPSRFVLSPKMGWDSCCGLFACYVHAHALTKPTPRPQMIIVSLNPPRNKLPRCQLSQRHAHKRSSYHLISHCQLILNNNSHRNVMNHIDMHIIIFLKQHLK